MKKITLFILSLGLTIGVLNAQTISSFKYTNDNSTNCKQVVNPNHIPTTFKVVGAKDPIPAGHARVTLAAGDIWGDGSGYQMLIDADGTAFGTIIPSQGPLTTTGDATPETYAEFEWKIPTNADGSLATTNIVINTSISIDIPAGTYDYCITNPTPGDRMWIAGGANSRGDDYTFNAGVEYVFTVALTGQNDNTTIQIIDPNMPAASITWDFNDGILPAGWSMVTADQNAIDFNIADVFPNNEAWIIIPANEAGDDYLAVSTSWFSPTGQADRWLITSRVNLQGGNYLQFDMGSFDPNFLEALEVKISSGSDQLSDFTTLENIASVPAGITTKTINLGSRTGSVRFAFRNVGLDKFIQLIDNVKVLGNALALNEVENTISFGVYPNPANDFVIISDANGADVRVLDMLGRTLINKTIKSSNETISIDNLQSGMYMIQITKEGQTTTQKLIKK